MSRPTDWEPLWHTDPVPGEPFDVRVLASKLGSVALEIEEQAKKLKSLCTADYWTGDAAATFKETAESTSTKLAKAWDRYDAASNALFDYVEVLEDQQSTSLRLLREAQALEDQRRTAQSRIDVAADAPADPAAPADPQRTADERLVGSFASDLRRLQSAIEECRRAVKGAGHLAANRIDSAIDDDGLKDGRFDGMKKWVSDRWDAAMDWVREHADIIGRIASICSWIATVLGGIAAVLALIPIIGGPLAGILGTAALVFGAVSLVCNTMLWLAGVQGLVPVLVDLVGVLSFGLGRAAIGGVKGGIAATRAAGKLTRAAQGVESAVVSRGGQLTGEAVDALVAGNRGLASQLTGVPESLLKGRMGNALGGLHGEFGEGGLKATRAIMESDPGRFPGLRALGDGFNPVSIGRDLVSDSRSLGNVIGDIRSGTHTLADFKPQHLSVLGHEGAAEVGHLSSLGHSMPGTAYSSTLGHLGSQVHVATGGFAAGVGVDIADKNGLFEPLGGVGMLDGR